MDLSIDKARKVELLAAAVTSIALVGLIVIVQYLAPPHNTPDAAVTPQEPIAVFPDFASIQSVDVKKQQFFDYVQDYVVAENENILALRRQLESYADISNNGIAFSAREREWVLGLAEGYQLGSGLGSDQAIVNELLLRVDVIPVSLVLAQAANESAWGTSRFALEGNNIFGQWCYEEGCGIVPRRRVSGATHEVKSFPTIESAVQAYFMNINSHHLYQYFRELRAQMRLQEQALDPMVLAFGLGRYSERGGNYVDEVQNIIIQNDLLLRDSG